MGKINASDKIMFENQKKEEKIWKYTIFLHKFPSKRLFRHRINGLIIMNE